MTPGRDLIELSKIFAKEDIRRSQYYLLSTVSLYVVFFLGSIFIQIVWVRLAFSIGSALLMCRLFVLYHDYQHGAILNNNFAIKWFMTFCGWYLLAPKSIWHESHNHHHNNNSKFSVIVLGSFPIMSKSEYLKSSYSVKLKYKIIRSPLVILFAYLPVFLISFCLYPFVESVKKYWDCGVSFMIHALIFIALYVYDGWTAVLFSQTLPFLMFSAIGGYIFYSQHNFSGVKFKSDNEWNYVEAALISSSFIEMNPFWQWVTANIGYHHIHHINSRIPFYRLPEAMKAIPDFQNPIRTSLSISDITSCLRLKLWDDERERMIKFSEL